MNRGLTKYSATLDMARFLFCVLVVVAHAAPIELVGDSISTALNSGIFSTHFFALSGFIICSTSGFWRDPFPVFAVRRLGRLLPVHWAGFALTAPWLFLGIDTTPVQEVMEAAFWWALGLQGFLWSSHSELYTSLNLPAWSVTPLLYGTIALPVLRFLRLHELSPLALTLAMAATWMLRLAITFVIYLPEPTGGLGAAHVRPEGHALEILLGGMTALLLAKPSVRNRMTWLASGKTLAAITAATITAVTIATATGGREGVYYLIHGPIFPLALLFVVSAYANRGALERFCSRPWVKTAGDLSILIFLLHMPFIYVSTRVLARLHLENSLWAGALSTLAVVAAVTALSYAILPWFNRLQTALKTPRPAPALLVVPSLSGPEGTADLSPLAASVSAYNSSAVRDTQAAAATAKGR